MKSYHNTTALTGKDLSKAIGKAKNQDEAILIFFKANPKSELTCWDVFNRFAFKHDVKSMLITSIRRSVDTLFNAGHLVQVGQRKEIFGQPNFTYKLKV